METINFLRIEILLTVVRTNENTANYDFYHLLNCNVLAHDGQTINNVWSHSILNAKPVEK